MNIAIIPWNDTFLQDKIFGEVDPSINYDDRLTSFSRIKSLKDMEINYIRWICLILLK